MEMQQVTSPPAMGSLCPGTISPLFHKYCIYIYIVQALTLFVICVPTPLMHVNMPHGWVTFARGVQCQRMLRKHLYWWWRMRRSHRRNERTFMALSAAVVHVVLLEAVSKSVACFITARILVFSKRLFCCSWNKEFLLQEPCGLSCWMVLFTSIHIPFKVCTNKKKYGKMFSLNFLFPWGSNGKIQMFFHRPQT